MRMSIGPRDFGDDAIGGSSNFSDLQPSEDNVKFSRVADEAKRASGFLRASKASEKQKQIARSNPMATEMTLRGCGLPEDRTPSCGARNRVAAQIRIEMCAISSQDSTAGQVFHDPSDRRAIERGNFAVSRRRTRVGNRERAQSAIKNRARTSAVRRVESLAAEYEFHRSHMMWPCYISRRTHDKENLDAGI